jgi:peptide deformylase
MNEITPRRDYVPPEDITPSKKARYFQTDPDSGKKTEIDRETYKTLKKEYRLKKHGESRIQLLAFKNLLKEKHNLQFVGESEIINKPARKFVPVVDQDLIDEFGTKAASFIGDYNGLGLAAPQLGIHVQMAMVRDVTGDITGKDKFFMIINPEIVEAKGKFKMKEGCFSVPTVQKKVRRHTKISVRFLDVDGSVKVINVNNKMQAAILQHEIDHLNGITIADK